MLNPCRVQQYYLTEIKKCCCILDIRQKLESDKKDATHTFDIRLELAHVDDHLQTSLSLLPG